MTLYLDASFIVSLFAVDSGTARARELVNDLNENPMISDFGRLEFASALSRLARINPRNHSVAQQAFAAFDAWSARLTTKIETTPADLIAAEATIRRLDTPLRTGDALHIAIADRIGATIITFDRKLAEAARRLGVAIVM